MKNARRIDPLENADMTRIIFSAGFWVTVLVFIVFGYAHALGDVCPAGSMKCGVSTENFAIATSVLQDENRKSESDVRASDSLTESRCAPEAAARSTNPSFPQIANWQRGGSMYAPGLSLSMTRRPEHVTLCPGPVEIPNSLNQ
jgi:hypothetical protein